MAIDIKIREQLERTLRESPEVLARIIGSAMDAIIAIDDAQRIVVFNAAAEKMFRCPASKAIGNSIEGFIPERFRAEHNTRVRRFDETGVTNRTLGSLGTVWGLRATGEEFPIEASISKVESGGKKFFTAVIRDITERHRAGDAVRESENRFRMVADTAPVLIWMSGTDRLCTYFNKPWLDFTGRSIEQELGNGWAEGVCPDDLQRCLDTYQQSFDRREKFRMEYRLRHYDGHYRWILDIGVPRFSQDGSFAGYIGCGVDVTDRKQVEDALARYAAIVQSSEDSIIATDVSGNITDWNKGAERLFGYSADEAVGKHIILLSTPDRSEEKRGNIKKVLNGESVKQFETVRRRKDGTDVDVSFTLSPIVDAAGRIVGISGIVRDITERKRVEESLRKSEERFRLAALAGKMFAYEWDVTTDVVLRSPEHVRVLGITEPLRFTHHQFVDKIHPDDRPTFIATLAGLTPEKPTGDVTYRVLLSSDAFVWVKSSGRAFFDGEGKMLRVIGMVADVTDQKLTEDALRASEGRLRLAQQAARIGTFERDVRTGRVTWAEGLESLYGLPPGGVDGKTLAFFNDLIHPADRERVAHLIQEALKTGHPTEGEWRAIWPDGSVHWIAGRWQVLMDDSGEPSRVVGVNMDVTERKLAEQSLADMTRKLIESQEQERSRIGRDLHDDINQRLAMLALELEQPHDPSEFQNRVQRFREELRQILDDVQALSHDLHSTKLEYLGVVAGMKSWCKEFAERQKTDVDFKSDVRSVVPLDIGRPLFRVLQEALHNSFKHSGVKRIEVRLREDSGEIHLIISDSGRGFDVEAALQGKGLGLTSMRERVRLVNGTIVIDSKPRGGTTIYARVPFPSEDNSQREAV